MVERTSNRYSRLFEIRLLHHYWLDEGEKVFDTLPKKSQELRLLSYDVRTLLTIRPTVATTSVLQGSGCIYKDTALGCIVAVPAGVAIPADSLFEFVVTVKDSAFFDYTALTLRPQKIHEFAVQSEQSGTVNQPREIKIYRYKENVAVLSNLTGTTRVLNGNTVLFLSREIPSLESTDLVESLIFSNNAILQLISDEPADPADQPVALKGNAPDLPVFVNQADVRPVAPPPGLSIAPVKGIELSEDIPDELFALIRLSAKPANNAPFNIVDRPDNAEDKYPVFQIRFRNRSTFWQYLKKESGAVDQEELKPLPLTNFGNAGTKQKPSPGLVEVKKTGDKVTRLVSKIFI